MTTILGELVPVKASARTAQALESVQPQQRLGRRSSTKSLAKQLDAGATRLLELTISLGALLLLAPFMLLIALAIKLDSPGPVFYKCRRVGRYGREFDMYKFRKMRDGVKGLPITQAGDARLTKIGVFLAKSKLDEIPQLWNVVRGEMALVGPRPEDPAIVALRPDEFEPVLRVKPGITGLCQLAYVDESSLLVSDDPVQQYLTQVLPQKLALDGLYAEARTLRRDLLIMFWTFFAVALRCEVSVDFQAAKPRLRAPKQLEQAASSLSLDTMTEAEAVS